MHESLDHVLSLLHDPDAQVCCRAVEQLGELGAEAPLEPLLATLHTNPYLSVRRAVLLVLGKFGTDAALEFLIAKMQDREWMANNADLAHTLIATLGRLEERAPVDVIVGCLRDPELASTALWTLCKNHLSDAIPVQSLLDLYERDDTGREDVLRHIDVLGKRLPLDFLAKILSEEYDSYDRERVASMFRQIEDEGRLIELVELASGRYRGAQEAVVRVLGLLAQYESIGLLLTTLCSGSREVSMAATDVLEKIADQVPRADLLVLLRHARADVRASALTILTSRSDEAPLPELIAALKDPDAQVRIAALNLCQERDTYLPLSYLIEATLDTSEYVVDAALSALSVRGKRDPEQAFAAVVRLLNREEYRRTHHEAFQNAIQALGELVSVEIVLQAFFASEGDELLAGILGSFGPQAPFEPLIVALQSTDDNLCSSAARALGATEKISHRLPLQLLLDQLADQDMRVRHGALALLRQVPASVPLEMWLDLLVSPEVGTRLAALHCIQAVAHPLPVEPILALLQDASAEVRRDAVAVLGKLGTAGPFDKIIPLLDDSDSWVRYEALIALKQPEILKHIPASVFVQAVAQRYHYPDHLTTALEALRDKDPQLAVKQAVLALGDGNYFVCETACEIIQAHGTDLIPAIVSEANAILTGGAPGRFFASHNASCLAQLIGYAGHSEPRLVTHLGELLSWPYWQVRLQAVLALGQVRQNIPETLIQRLTDLLNDPESPAVRMWARWALERIHTEE